MRFHPFRITYVSLVVAKNTTAGRGKCTVFLCSSPCIIQTIEDLGNPLLLIRPWVLQEFNPAMFSEKAFMLQVGFVDLQQHHPTCLSWIHLAIIHSTEQERGETRLGLVMYPQKRLHANTPRDPKRKGDNVAWEFPVRVHWVRLVHRHVSGVVCCVGRFRAFDHRASSWGGESSEVK